MPTPEELARETIDALLTAAGWAVQDYRAYNPNTACGIALREVLLKEGRCDYLLMLDRAAIGVIEAEERRRAALRRRRAIRVLCGPVAALSPGQGQAAVFL